ATLQEDIASLVVSRQEFVNKVLKSYKKTLYEWKEDVIRPKLLMSKMCQDRVRCTEEDLRMAFEAHHGEKIGGRIMLCAPGEEKNARAEYARLRDSEQDFANRAKMQASAQLASKGGKLEPFGRYSTGNEMLERAAFQLLPGQVTEVLQVP